MPQLYGYALSGVERCGAARSGYTSPKIFVSVNGVQVATARPVAANKVLVGSLTVTEILNQIPNTAAFTLMGVEPSEGQDVVITIGSINNLDRLFAGTILNRAHHYLEKPATWQAPVNVVDYTWHLTRRRVSGSFTTVAPAVVAAAIVAAVPGFTVSVAAGLPTLDAISFSDIDALSAVTQLANRCGGYCDVDGHKVVKLFVTDASVTNPTDLTAAHLSLSEFAFTRDLSQVRTRIVVEGGGVNALAVCAPGETIIPVGTSAWYNPSGGTVKSGAQHVTYGGIQIGLGGSLVGPGATPASAPVLTLVAGVGLSAGVYQYAYTDVTPSGESLPSPLATITTGTLDPPAAPVATATHPAGGSLSAGWYNWALTYVTAAGETIAGVRQLGNVPAGYSVDFSITTGPTGVTQRKFYRTAVQPTQALAAAATLLLDTTIADNTTTAITDTLADGALGAAAPGSNTATAAQVALSGIAIGASPTTARKIYRTVVGGAQLKLQQTIADNTSTTAVTDATADGSLGANAPTSDTSALTQPSGQILAGATTLLVAGAGSFAAIGGWAVIGNGQQVIRYGGLTGNTLTGIPVSGVGAITATVAYNSTITAAPALISVPASGGGAIRYPLLPGDPVNLLVQVDDLSAQAALAALLGGGDDGVVEEFLQDGTIGETEARARGQAQLALASRVLVSVTYKTRDRNTHAGRTVHVNLGSPTSLTGDFQIQHVTIDRFDTALLPTYTVQASSSRFSLEDLLRLARAA